MRRRNGAALGVFLAAGAISVTACATTNGAAVQAAAGDPAPGALPGSAPASPVPAPGAGAPTAAANPWLDPAREVLVQHCGRCHRGDLPTALPKALAIFDLTRPIWNEHLVRPQYEGILTRVHESSAIEADEVAAVEAFVRCARDGVCDAS